MNYTDLTFEQITDQIETLLHIQSENLDAEALRSNKIFTELNRIYIQWSRKLMVQMRQQDKVEHNRYRHYAGKETAEHYKKDPLHEAVLKSDIPNMMNIDPVVIEIRDMVKETERVVKLIEDAKGSLRSRGFDIKNAIEWRKIMMGA